MSTAQPRPPDVDPRMQRLLTLLTLHKNARHKQKMSELAFLMVNQTFNLVPYRHGIFWRWDGHRVTVEAASGLVELDPNGPYAQWIGKVIGRHIGEADSDQWLKIGDQPQADSDAKCLRVTAADVGEAERAEWGEWASSHALLVTMKGNNGKTSFGLWLDREEMFHDTDVAFLEDLGDGFAHIIRKMEGGGRTSLITRLLRPTRSGMTIFLVILGLLSCIPTRMTATAPAEVVAHQPLVVTVPFDGIIERAMVEPNQMVQAGQVLFVMDSTTLKNGQALTEGELETAQMALDKAEREALSDPKKRNEISVLKAQIANKLTEKNYADEMLAKAEIKAEHAGIIIFGDANAIRGRPVRTGEQVMQLAKPEETELVVRVAVDNMIDIDTSVPAKFFLNVTPLSSMEAKVENISYQPTPDADGIMSYKIRARFIDHKGQQRIGSTGTAKVYGETSIMLFNAMRRPLVALRRKLGV